MWFPQETGMIMKYYQSHETFNVTICDLMEGSSSELTSDCHINYDFMYAGILLGIAEVITCIVVGLWGLKIDRKILICKPSC